MSAEEWDVGKARVGESTVHPCFNDECQIIISISEW